MAYKWQVVVKHLVTKRFLDALECPEDATPAGKENYWPIGVPIEQSATPEHDLNYQFKNNRGQILRIYHVDRDKTFQLLYDKLRENAKN